MGAPGKEGEAARTSLELLYNISRELAAALELPVVLRRVLYLSVKNVGAINGSIIVLDGNGQPVESAIIVNGDFKNITTSQLSITFERGLAGWVASQRQAALLRDTSQDSRWLRRPDDAVDQTGAKSAVSAPILARDQLVGVITLVHPAPGFFALDHLALIQSIADQAGIAVLNARLYAESQRQARVMTAVAESAAVITASLNVEDVLQRILEQISQALRVEVVSLALIDPLGKELVFRASTGQDETSVVGVHLELGKGIAGWVAKEGVGAVVPDAYNDPRFNPEIDQLLSFKTRGIACAPIRSRGQVIGILEALNPNDGVFDPDALLVLTGIGSLAGSAIRHAQLFESLQAAHQRYRELFQDSIDSILITDWDGNIVEANRQAEVTIGLNSETLRDLKINDLNVIDAFEVGLDFKNLSTGKTISYESILKSKSGREVPVQVYAREVHIEGVSHLQWILGDITERKDLDNLRNDLTSMIYHDLRSPLANIVSSLDVVATMLPGDAETSLHALLNIAVRSTERIQRLTDSLLDINRLEEGQPVGDRQPIQPAALFKDALEAVLPVAQNKDIKIRTNVPKQLPKVFIDEDMIRRVLINLMENAVKYTPPGSKISLGAKQRGKFLQIWVQDNGPGIPASEHERVFDKFTRLSVKNGPRGLGLGLAYCRLAVNGHGGRIWVESEPGIGARFNFTLPIADETE
jgi:NtrC-family two-component system sensor histidine kinase KinB